MFTTFDEVYKIYLRMVKGVESYSLPQSIQEQIDLIEIGVLLFNRKRENHEIICDVGSEIIKTKDEEKLSDNEILLLASCMALQTYRDMLTELVSMLSIATKDSALKDYKGQASTRRQQVKDQETFINNLVFSMSEFDEDEEV